MALAARHGIPVIEDCAQAFLATYGGQPGRHASAPSAASACSRASTSPPARAGWWSRDDPALARRMYLFINKAWGYGDPKPDHYFLALNYRMTELQGAVALAQLRQARRQSWQRRVRHGGAADRGAAGAARDRTPRSPDRATCTPTGSTACRSIPSVIPGGSPGLGRRAQGLRHRLRARATSRSRPSSARSSASSGPSATSRWPVHAGPARGRRLRRRASSRARSRRSSTCWCCPGTRSTPRTTWTTSAACHPRRGRPAWSEA